MLDSVRHFLRLFEDATPAEGRTPERLCDVLDRLLIAYHETCRHCARDGCTAAIA